MQIRDVYRQAALEGVEITARIRRVRDLFRAHRSSASKFLDIGCGAGVTTTFIAAALGRPELHGIEFNPGAAAAARGRDIDVRDLDLSVDAFPYEDGTFDAIFCGEVLEHVPDTDHLMLEIRRVLADDGVCVLTTPNLAAWHNRIALLFGYQPFLSQVSFHHGPGRPPFVGQGGGEHLRVFTHRALVEFMAILGFDVVARRGAGAFEIGDPGGPRWARLVFGTIDNAIARIRPSLACDVIFVLRKSR